MVRRGQQSFTSFLIPNLPIENIARVLYKYAGRCDLMSRYGHLDRVAIDKEIIRQNI